MSSEQVVKWTCDRCGKTEYSSPGYYPMDWKKVDIHDYLEGITEDALCPECAEEFIPKWKNFMKTELIRTVFPSAQQWIPCSERLPEYDYTDVLVCVYDKRKGCEKDFYVIQAYTSGRHWEPTLAVDMTDFDVVAWMPLPSPYREETES